MFILELFVSSANPKEVACVYMLLSLTKTVNTQELNFIILIINRKCEIKFSKKLFLHYVNYVITSYDNDTIKNVKKHIYKSCKKCLSKTISKQKYSTFF